MRHPRWPFLIAAALFGAATRSIAAPTLSLLSSTSTPSLNSRFEVSMSVSAMGTLRSPSPPSLGTFDLLVEFDPVMFSLADIAVGDPALGDRANQLDLEGAGAVSSFVLTAPGKLKLVMVSLDSAITLNRSQLTNFTLLKLVFNALGRGSSSLRLTVNSFGDAVGGDLGPALNNGGVVPLTVPPNVAIVDPDSVCSDTEEGFQTVPNGSVDGILVRPGVQFAERFAGQTLQQAGGSDRLGGAPASPLALVAGADGENLFRSTLSGRPQLSGAAAGNNLRGTTAVLFAADQSELALGLFQRVFNDIRVDVYDRQGRRIDAVILPFSNTDGEALLGLVRRGGTADIAGFTLEIGADNPDRAINAQSMYLVRFTASPDSCRPELVFLRGDCNGDGRSDGVVDALTMLQANFIGGVEISCKAACDANGDGDTGGVLDALTLLTANFLGRVDIPEPYPRCGAGALETDGRLGCERSLEDCR